ncbi:hypothetical protein CesoFtcFv8_027320 [Champsocephalus esox]|uniref:SH3 domain-containing YSC84-like protein 1 n=1 Tax=Champsocephalus esox TaxID=159716 RepID=A0AAN8AYV0_9TELE|nr:hypothetical protein CesoFtcFv8_027320 [Champsocephalus esox]
MTTPVNNPIPSNLKSEAKKAAKILRDFTEISNRTGLTDRLIPPHVIAKAEGLAIISVIKAGFMITARGGQRHRDRQAGGQTLVGSVRHRHRRPGRRLRDRGGGVGPGDHPESAPGVDAFTKGGNLTLGGETARWPWVRSEGTWRRTCRSAARRPCSHTNRKFYGREIRASAILNGDVEPPPECYDLYHILDEYTDAYTADWTSKNMRPKSSGPPSRPSVPPQQKPSPGYQQQQQQPAGGGASGELVVKATHPFTGQQPGDLSFVPGDSITVVTKTESQYDWWEGRHSDGRVGIFPANFVAF